MKAATLPVFGDPDALMIADVPMPAVGPRDVLIAVAAAGVNRADVLQRRGHYPAPPGAPAWPGLEVAGVVERVGTAVTEFRAGERVCALLPGGGYAQYAACHASLVMPTPPDLSDVEAAALPEAVCTVWSNFRIGGVPGATSLLVHGGSGGIGTTAIQLAKAVGMRVMATAGGAQRAERCVELGADAGIDYRAGDFAPQAAALGHVDMVLDCIGGDYLERNLTVLADDGTLVIIGLQSGATAQVNLATLLSRRLTIAGSTLRSRPLEQRAAIVRDVVDSVWPLIPSRMRPVIHEVYPLTEVATAHRVMDAKEAFGKVVLTVS